MKKALVFLEIVRNHLDFIISINYYFSYVLRSAEIAQW